MGYPTTRGTDYRGWSDEKVNALIANLGADPQLAEEIKKEIAEKGSSPREYLLYLTGQDPYLRNLAAKPEGERTAAEQETLDRALHLGRRLFSEAPKVYAEILDQKAS